MTTNGPSGRRHHLASSPFRPEAPTEVEAFHVGDRVSHTKHGLGVVIGRDPSSVTLRFATGVVRVASPYAKLTLL